ncbi:MAG TPA: hypothetical protein VKV36_10600 [Acidimicrobiales bacterium]|nr:hypothetical protein [Acidimicrobiales bacterium]
MSTVEGRRRLQQELAQEVDRRGASWSALAADLGTAVNVATLRSYVQQGVAEHPQRKTLAALDRFMRWEPGSARRVLEGGEPTARASGAEPAEAPALAGEKWERLTTDQRRAVLHVIDSMLEGR